MHKSVMHVRLAKLKISAYCGWDNITGTQAVLAYPPLKRKQPARQKYLKPLQGFDDVLPVFLLYR